MCQTIFVYAVIALFLSACTNSVVQSPSDLRAILKQSCVPIDQGLPAKEMDFQNSLEECSDLVPGSLIEGGSNTALNVGWEAKNRSKGLVWFHDDVPVMISVQAGIPIALNDVMATYGSPEHYSVINAGTAECHLLITLMYESMGSNYVVELPCNEQTSFSDRAKISLIELYTPYKYMETIRFLYSMSDGDVAREQTFISSWKGIEHVRNTSGK